MLHERIGSNINEFEGSNKDRAMIHYDSTYLPSSTITYGNEFV